MTMTGNIDRVEVITSVQRRQRWSAEEKALRRPHWGQPGVGCDADGKGSHAAIRFLLSSGSLGTDQSRYEGQRGERIFMEFPFRAARRLKTEP